ncbi:MAG: alcohol dehydrogenase catalytic domain-containing protein, partial [Deinococcus sp.]|nr:alcohol dehydrogenase catalytic domain-containing protein [Deinococcus sp.]
MGVRAVVMERPGKLAVKQFPYPKVTQGAMLVRITLSGICGTDKHSFQGFIDQYSGHAQPKRIPFPIIPGHENVAVIVEMPTPWRDFEGQPLAVGDRVVVAANVSCGQCYYCRQGFPYYFCENTTDYGNNLSAAEPPHLFGGWAEYLYVLPGSCVYKVPPGLPDHHAVMGELMAVTASLDRAKQFSTVGNDGFRFSDTVLVQGVAAVGICHVIKAQMLGAGQILATDLSNCRLQLAKEFGATLCLNVAETTLEERRERIAEMTHGRGPDVVVECAGVPEAVV